MIRLFANPDHALQNGRAELAEGELKPVVERPERMVRILDALAGSEFSAVESPADAGLGPIKALCDNGYVEFLQQAWDLWTAEGRTNDALPLNWVGRGMRHVRPRHIDGLLGHYSFDAGTPITATTWKAVYGSAQTALAAAAAVATGSRFAFAGCRPPGHHASGDTFGGYCFLNNAGLAAQALRDAGAKRVAIVDVDYHHGNGTQALFYDRGDILFVSLHADPAWEYPYFLGYADEVGAGPGVGANRNLPMPFGTRWDRYAQALEAAGKTVSACGVDALVISFGADPHEDDPISQFALTTADFGRMGAVMGQWGLPTCVVMEGGYDLGSIGANVVTFLRGLVDPPRMGGG